MSQLKTIGVIGAGVMGVGVAQNLAQKGFEVLLIDQSESILEKAKEEIQKNVRFLIFFKREKGLDSPETLLKRIHTSTNYECLEGADYLIENITEKWVLKEELYKTIDPIAPPQIVFAANTSAIPITKIGSLTKRPTQVIGIHFMNPVPIKPFL